MSLDPRLSPEEQAVAQGAVSAGFLTSGELEVAIAARDAQRRAGQATTLLPVLAQRLRPDQLAHLRGVHQRSTGRLGPPVAPPSSSGKRLGRYAVIRELGVGGMGAVYLAQDPELDRQVAVKVVLPGADAETIERTRVEAQASSRLDHPGIVKLHTVERDANNRLLIALEVIEGGSLSDRLKREGPLPSREAAELMVQVARAMQYAHDRGVLHRDLKPANILLTADGRTKVTDFGLAKQQDDDQGLTKTGVIMGSPGYMAPEQAASERDRIDHRADVYGLGATLFALLTGHPPFQGSLVSIVSGLLTQDAPTARSVNPQVDSSLSAICALALAREPEDRIQSAAELADELQGYLAGEARAPRRLWPIPLMLGVLVIAAAVVFRPQAPVAPGAQPSASPSASPHPSPTVSKPPVDPSDPANWPARISLDGEALQGVALPHLEVWGTRLVETDGRGIRLRCTAPNTTELLLPLEYSGGPFRLELTGRIAQLEHRNRLSITFHHWPNEKNRRALSGVPAKERGPEWPRYAASIHGVRRAAAEIQEDVVWVPGFYPGYGKRRPKEPRWERSPAAPLTMALTYDPKRCAFEYEVRVGGNPPYRLAEHLPEPLEPGSYRLRLGVNLRPRHSKKTISYNDVLRGRSSTFGPSNSVCDVGGLRLVLRAPKADTAALTVSPPHTIRAEVGRLLRSVWARRDLEATENALGSIASGSAAGHEETPHYAEMAAARYGLAHLHEQNGKPVEAAKLYKALDYGFEMQDQGKQKPRITYWIHRAWVRELLTADEGRLIALQRAHALLQLKQSTVKDRVDGLFQRPGSTPITDGELLVTGMRVPPRVDVGETAKRVAGFLARFRAAELLVLTTGRPDLCTPAARGMLWYALGNMPRALELIGGGPLNSTDASLAGRAAFRLARWQACVDVLERHPAAQALKPGRQLLELARRRLKDG